MIKTNHTNGDVVDAVNSFLISQIMRIDAATVGAMMMSSIFRQKNGRVKYPSAVVLPSIYKLLHSGVARLLVTADVAISGMFSQPA